METSLPVTRGITVWQPWAGLLAAGIKDVENRSWYSTHRGWVALHAGRTVERDYLRGLEECGEIVGIPIPSPPIDLCRVTGAFVGAALVVDWSTADHRERRGMTVSPWHGYTHHGAYLEDAVAFREPIPARGRQGLFVLTQDEALAVSRALDESGRF